MNWRLAIAALWVVPVSLLLAVGSKKLQDVMGTKNILAKRVAADGIQECIETAREIKACNQKEHYMQELHKKLDAVEKAAIRSELTTGTFISGAQMFLRLGMATTVLSFISALPQGYHTVLGENGSTLSGGERQRISIARALLKDAPVILLDEATASLDVENETAVQLALSRLIQQKTVLVIAHRMRTVATADHIVVLEEGKVCQQGNPAELLAQPGPYQHMVRLQQQSESWAI